MDNGGVRAKIYDLLDKPCIIKSTVKVNILNLSQIQMCQIQHLGQTSARHVRFANSDPVDSCDKFEYLGVPTSNAETVFRSRLSKAWAAATKLRSIFNSKANDY